MAVRIDPIKLRVYLDTSVLSAYLDSRMPDRRDLTAEFWGRRAEYELATSELAREELGAVADAALRERLLGLLDEVTVHPVSAEMEELADLYIRNGIFAPSTRDDALHVAAASLTRQDILLSWNFKHLVNRRSRALVALTNILLGLSAIDILAPPEL